MCSVEKLCMFVSGFFRQSIVSNINTNNTVIEEIFTLKFIEAFTEIILQNVI